MSSLKVAVRVRPFSQREIDMDASLIVQMDGKKTRLLKPKLSSIRDSGRDNYHDFTFDYSYWSYNDNDNHFVDQEQVYNDLGTDVIDCAFQGYNACVFAYGQTGSGKTFTMMGSYDNPGLIPRICQELFKRIKIGQESGTGYKTHASYLEIYNERVKDLLGSSNVGHGLRVREHRNLGPYVENLSQHAVSDYEEIQDCISRGNHQRTTASTNMNDTSSRSHAIFTITFVQAGFMNDMPSETVSKIHLVDLAGSERAYATGATGQRLKEGAHINKSLVTLGSVISALAEQTNPTTKRILYIPYRDSVLTWLLKDSLGGNSKTIMIAAISPAECNYGETLSTLRYANRAKNIINKPTINEDPNVKLIRELRDEINKLKLMLSGEVILMEPSSKMLEDLMKKEEQEKVLTEEWTEKWKEAQLILKEQKSLGLRKAGVGVVLDSEMPHLIGIHNEITTGVTLYSLKEGETYIGTEEADEPQDIVLSGTGMQAKHCSIILKNGIATLYPFPHAQCWLNANLINEPTGISQGDIILLGRTNIFRYNNPAEAAKLRHDIMKSRIDLSRLSLITSSRENLFSSSNCVEDENFNNSIMNSSMNKIRQYHPSSHICREDPELQDENKKILETIENALKQLNIERVQMFEQYKSKVHKLSLELERLRKEEKNASEILNCREQELLAKKDMFLWDKNNEKIQIDIVCRQITALQTQLDSKKRDFFEYVAKELQELQDCGKLDEVGIKITDTTLVSDKLLLQASESLDPYSSQLIKDTINKNTEEIKRLDEQIIEKEKILDISKEKLKYLDSEILSFGSQLKDLKQEKDIMQPEIQSETEDLKLKKQSMKLNLTKTTNDADAQTDLKTESSLNTLETCDTTYHTANSDCSFVSATPTSHGNDNKLLSDNNSNSEPETPLNHIMSDSGVCLDLIKSPLEGPSNNGGLFHNIDNNHFQKPFQNNYNRHNFNYNKNTNNNSLMPPLAGSSNSNNRSRNGNGIISDEDTTSCSSSDHNQLSIKGSNLKISRPYCIMFRLRRKMAAQKALIMKNLELDVNKTELDEQIAQLQELKRKYVEIEKEIQVTGGHSDCCMDRDIDLIRDNLECISLNDQSKIPSFGSPTSTLVSPMNESFFSTPISERNCLSQAMIRSCPSAIDFNKEPDKFLLIPSFILRGTGKQTHFEYEIRINLSDGKLNILRRYSKFRELHLAMKHSYGAKVAVLPFPRREIFSSNSESVAKYRRRLLEIYLRRLLVICSKIPQSPIYDGPDGPGITKASLAQLSPFFKRGLFECGKYGTG